MTDDRQDLPTSSDLHEAVVEAVIATYARLHSMDEVKVRECLAGGVPFDSILGVELASAIEDVLAIKISEKSLMNTKVYQSLAAFAAMVQVCVSQSDAAKSSTR
jgi:acyl carrier protein